ncbi:MAG: CAP domain-containing protein [Mogibacterium sp.]|nr:CAP domain-containing protein [Mogibacterium sp.]
MKNRSIRSILIILTAVMITLLAAMAVNAEDTLAVSSDASGAAAEAAIEAELTELAGPAITGNEVTAQSELTWIDTTDCYTLLNGVRKDQHSKNIKALKKDKALEKIAMKRAKEIAETGMFSHTRPNGKSGISLVKGKKAKGENLAKGQKSAEAVTDAWYASTGHRENMLRGCFKKVGIAACSYNGKTYWVQIFSS